MADIAQELQAILDATYGEEVRGSIHDAIEKINDVSEVVISTGTAISSETDSVEGFYENSLYLNLTNQYLWKCNGSSWELIAQLKGIQGDRGQKGTSVVDAIDNEDGTFSISLSDGTITDPINLPKGDKGDTGDTGSAGQNGISILSFVDRPSGAIHNIWAQMSDGSERLVGSISDGIVEGGDGDMKKSVYATLDTDNRGIVDKALVLNDGTRNVTIDYVTNKADKSTTLAGYGIANAYTKGEVDSLIGSSAAAWDNVTGKPFNTVSNDFSTSGNALALSNNNKNLIKGISELDTWRDYSYEKGRLVIRNNRVYKSLVDDNLNHDPLDEEVGSEYYWIETTLGEEINNTKSFSGTSVLTASNSKLSVNNQRAYKVGKTLFLFTKIVITAGSSFSANEVLATLNTDLIPKEPPTVLYHTAYGNDNSTMVQTCLDFNSSGKILMRYAQTFAKKSYITINLFYELN